MKKLIINSILYLIIGLAIGMLITYRSASPITSLNNEKEKIDSIQTIVDTLIETRGDIEESIEIVVKSKIIKVDSVKSLPTNDAVDYLNRRLHESDL